MQEADGAMRMLLIQRTERVKGALSEPGDFRENFSSDAEKADP